jgi:signal peptidase II
VLRSLAAKRWFFLVLSLIIFALDQATKFPFRSWTLYQSKPVLPFLSFTYVQNTGSLFGLFQGNAFVLGLVSLSVALGICWYVWHLPKNAGLLPYLTLGFLLGGALGNMLDRLVFGFVVDFFDLQWQGRNIWPVFNVADIAVDVAIGFFVLMAFLEPKDTEKTEAEKTDEVKTLKPLSDSPSGSLVPLPSDSPDQENALQGTDKTNE